MTTDPVCGMNVEPDKAAGSMAYGGQTYWFCSPACLSKFKADPAKYVGGKSAARSGGMISTLLKKLRGDRV